MVTEVPYILVVDDEWMSREMLEAHLQLAGYRVGSANSGEQALARVAEEAPDLIMVDVHMSGIDGFEVCRRLRADDQTRDIPVLLVTAFESDEDRERAAEVRASGFVIKPFDVQALLAHVATLLHKR